LRSLHASYIVAKLLQQLAGWFVKGGQFVFGHLCSPATDAPGFGRLGREYQKVVFDKALLPSDATLEWVTPGHPLFEVVPGPVAPWERA